MSVWTPAPETIRSFRQNGMADMGDVTDRQSVARFALREIAMPDSRIVPVDTWTLVGVRARFIGGSGSATVTLKLDHRDESGLYDWTLREWATRGEDNRNILHRPSDESDLYGAYPFFYGDELVFEWTNPDAGTMRWCLEVFLSWSALQSDAVSPTLRPRI